MNKKFISAPTYENTEVLYKKNIKIGNVLDAEFSIVLWYSIPHYSIMFVSEDVKTFTDDELRKLILQHSMVDKDSIISVVKLSSGYTKVNYNMDFEIAKL